MDLVILTGMSGSGIVKSMDTLEDLGYFCVNNVPPHMLEKFAQLNETSKGYAEKIALLVDSRSRAVDNGFSEQLDILKEKGYKYKLLFIDADDNVLLKKFKENRKDHPLMSKKIGTLIEAIEAEREMLVDIKGKSDFMIDTSAITHGQLHILLTDLFCKKDESTLPIQLMSFGYKYGIPMEADIVMDMRCLPNPYYVRSLRHQTGTDKDVASYVMAFEESRQMLEKLKSIFSFLYPLYVKEGKSRLVIAIGCTGGMHRSVTIVEALMRYFMLKGIITTSTHRDKDRVDQLQK